MNLSKTQKTILIIGVVIIILMGLFPPWASTEGIHKMTLGYAFIATRHYTPAELDISRLCVQWIMVIFATGLGVLLSGRSSQKTKKTFNILRSGEEDIPAWLACILGCIVIMIALFMFLLLIIQ